MNKIIKWFTIKRMFVIGIISTISLGVLSFNNIFYILYDIYSSTIIDVVNYLYLFFMFCILFLFFSIIFFFLKQETIFYFWKKTLFFYFFIYLFFIILVPWDWGDVYLPIYKGTVALFLSVLYSIISIILIIYKSLKKEN